MSSWYGPAGPGACSDAPGVAREVGGTLVGMEQRVDPGGLAAADLAALVPAWLDWAGVAERLGVTPAKVRTMVRDHELAAAVPVSGAGPQVPEAFLGDDGAPVKGLAGLLTLLHDAGFDDRECIAWIFTDDDYPGRPIDALRENRGSEVKRRAQALAL